MNHLRMSLGAGNIGLRQLIIKGDGFGELGHDLRRSL
jgi:hypothetical protein